MSKTAFIISTWVVAGLVAMVIDRLRKTEKLNLSTFRFILFGYISLVIVLFLPLMSDDANEFEDQFYN
jgi:predicted membrane channel-forming protein YqfA (hemolysin III family)